MDQKLEQVIALLKQHGDSLVPMDAVKKCIAVLEQDQVGYQAHKALLRSQISIWGSDDTQMFSRQLTAKALADELSAL